MDLYSILTGHSEQTVTVDSRRTVWGDSIPIQLTFNSWTNFYVDNGHNRNKPAIHLDHQVAQYPAKSTEMGKKTKQMNTFHFIVHLSFVARDKTAYLFNLALKVLTLDQIRNIIFIIILLLATLALLHVLVALGELAEGGEAVRAQLVQDTGNQLGEFFFLAVAVEGEGVGGDGGVHLGVN